jgi:hypothetical protein
VIEWGITEQEGNTTASNDVVKKTPSVLSSVAAPHTKLTSTYLSLSRRSVLVISASRNVTSERQIDHLNALSPFRKAIPIYNTMLLAVAKHRFSLLH